MIRKLQKECESSCEYILPDYLGDVKKLLMTSAKAVPSGQFDGEREVECAGIVTYDIVYLDSENKLSSASFSSDYDFKFSKNGENYSDAYVATQLANFGVRLTGPRRMIAKANVASEICVMESFEIAETGSAFSEREELEKITKTVNIESAIKSDALEREYAEEIASLEGISADEIEVITSNAYVRISESIPVDDGVNIKGVLVVNAIIRTPDTSVFAIRREIPFDETVSINGVGEDMTAVSDAFVSSLVLGINDGENTAEIVANVIMEFSSLAYYNESIEVISDAYLKSKDTVAEYENLSFTSHLAARTKTESQELKIPLSELGTDALKEILALNQDFRSLKLENSENSSCFSGEVAFSGVACEISEDGTTNITNLKFTAPMSINVNTSCQKCENNKLFAKIAPAGCEWVIDGENLILTLWYTVTYSLSEEESVSCLSSCEVAGDSEYVRKASRISVYYPDENETLFDVAKKFHTSVKDIAADNMIAEPTALGIPTRLGLKKLIIR